LIEQFRGLLGIYLPAPARKMLSAESYSPSALKTPIASAILAEDDGDRFSRRLAQRCLWRFRLLAFLQT